MTHRYAAPLATPSETEHTFIAIRHALRAQPEAGFEATRTARIVALVAPAGRYPRSTQ